MTCPQERIAELQDAREIMSHDLRKLRADTLFISNSNSKAKAS